MIVNMEKFILFRLPSYISKVIYLRKLKPNLKQFCFGITAVLHFVPGEKHKGFFALFFDLILNF